MNSEVVMLPLFRRVTQSVAEMTGEGGGRAASYCVNLPTGVKVVVLHPSIEVLELLLTEGTDQPRSLRRRWRLSLHCLGQQRFLPSSRPHTDDLSEPDPVFHSEVICLVSDHLSRELS